MSKFQRLDNEEEIKIDIDEVNDVKKDKDKLKDILNIILRNPMNEDIKFPLDIKQIISVKELRTNVYKTLIIIYKILDNQCLKIN